MSESTDQPSSDVELFDWCERQLGSRPVQLLFRIQHLSTVLGCRLADGREVVLKLRPYEERLLECQRVQAHLHAAGYPVPRPLAGPALLDGEMATAEELVHGGEERRGGLADAPRYGESLALQIRLCDGHRLQSTLQPAPPWLGWLHAGPGLWPRPDDLEVDLNEQAGPHWLADVAHRAAALLLGTGLTPVVGHADWHPGNLRWLDGRLHTVFDWDSLALLPEAALAGGASVLYTGDARAAASIEESASFFDCYASARGRDWNHEESCVFWAAGLWNLAFDAKKQTLDGVGRSLESIERTAEQRLRRAGL